MFVGSILLIKKAVYEILQHFKEEIRKRGIVERDAIK
jgi:hypothetical protein